MLPEPDDAAYAFRRFSAGHHPVRFRTRERQARVGRNPKTGTRVDVPAKRIPYFKPSKELKDLVNEEAVVAATPKDPPPAGAGQPN